jgi:hypothetical protein
MKINITLNMSRLKPRQQLAKVQTVITHLTGHAIFTAPSPPLPEMQANHDAAKLKLDQIDAMKKALVTLQLERDALMNVVRGDHAIQASYVENKCLGIPANATGAGYDLMIQPASIPFMAKVENHILTASDDPGTANAACAAMPRAKSYELRTSADGLTWVHYKTSTSANLRLTGFPSGQKLWTQMRAINKKGEGPWSDPACAMIP